MNCEICGVEFEPRRTDSKYCSAKCRKIAYNKRSVGTDKRSEGTDNVVVAERIIPDLYFEFYTETKDRVTAAGKVPGEKSPTRKAKYWYDVPLAAIPVIKKGYPEMPDYMNGRQYFLWWKNEFKMKNEQPEIVNPLPKYDKLEYVRAGEGSRHWGTV